MCDENGEFRGFGFVCFSTADAAQKAIAKMHGRNTDLGKLYVNYTEDKNKRKVKQADKYRQRNLYINDIHPSVNNQALREAFRPFGRLVSAEVWMFYLLRLPHSKIILN